MHKVISCLALTTLLANYRTQDVSCLFNTSIFYSFSVNYEKPDGPNNILLHPMYVSTSDNLNSSNKFTNSSSHSHLNFNKKRNKSNRRYQYDAVRYSNSFSSVDTVGTKKESNRPHSVGPDTYYLDWFIRKALILLLILLHFAIICYKYKIHFNL